MRFEQSLYKFLLKFWSSHFLYNVLHSPFPSLQHNTEWLSKKRSSTHTLLCRWNSWAWLQHFRCSTFYPFAIPYSSFEIFRLVNNAAQMSSCTREQKNLHPPSTLLTLFQYHLYNYSLDWKRCLIDTCEIERTWLFVEVRRRWWLDVHSATHLVLTLT